MAEPMPTSPPFLRCYSRGLRETVLVAEIDRDWSCSLARRPTKETIFSWRATARTLMG